MLSFVYSQELALRIGLLSFYIEPMILLGASAPVLLCLLEKGLLAKSGDSRFPVKTQRDSSPKMKCAAMQPSTWA